ncbi:hypothetical protein DKX38_017828 [Salix brachista]|uniref:S-locus receptor kinase C-terminal domain-containing protein n=1 Tax=Salix brachista TaxID=2182728 RepID=A0A5N5KWP3_9ROSI|nr:hypothetical protein DKX38_017828 [Salix brachista]
MATNTWISICPITRTENEFRLTQKCWGLELVVRKNSVLKSRSGPWNGVGFSGLPNVKPDPFLTYAFVSNDREAYLAYDINNSSIALTLVWKLYKKGRSLELIDELKVESCYVSEVLKSIHVGLLCVQHSPEHRPSMSTVVLMLGGDGVLPQPKEPGFFTERKLIEENKKDLNSTNEVTITTIDGR